jgi:hypothetical protein
VLLLHDGSPRPRPDARACTAVAALPQVLAALAAADLTSEPLPDPGRGRP